VAACCGGGGGGVGDRKIGGGGGGGGEHEGVYPMREGEPQGEGGKEPKRDKWRQREGVVSRVEERCRDGGERRGDWDVRGPLIYVSMRSATFKTGG